MKRVEELYSAWWDAGSAVFLTGAGVSTESGLFDFTGVGGFYSGFSTSTLLSREFMLEKPEKFQEFCRSRLYPHGVVPNIFHKSLALWERVGLVSAVITQNIDYLHHIAGSQNIIELHGNVMSVYCDACKETYSNAKFLSETDVIHRCSCGGIIRPSILLYGEALDKIILHNSLELIDNTPLLIVVGTRVRVTAPLDIVERFKQHPGVSVYIGDTPPKTCEFDIVIEGQIGKITEQLLQKLR